MSDAGRKYRIWAQGGTDQIGHANYLAKLLPTSSLAWTRTSRSTSRPSRRR